MIQKVLITGGGGFLGVNLSQLLINSGYHVKVLDNLSENTHPVGIDRPENLHENVEFIKGDLRDRETVDYALKEVEFVIHLASVEGVGHSMFKIKQYIDNNSLGTSVLLESLVRCSSLKKLIVASSMAVYGEGMYVDKDSRPYQVLERKKRDLDNCNWNLTDNIGEDLIPLPTPEVKAVNPLSIYGQSKFDQERLCLLMGKAYNLPVGVLRFFNIYGPGQSLSNPTGDVLAIFGARLLKNVAPLLYEDGFQLRDFTHVKDASQACKLILEHDFKGNEIFNVGSGKPYPIREVALKLAMILGKNKIQPFISKRYRNGDVRHCFADISKATTVLGYKPSVDFNNGLFEMAEWLKEQIPPGALPETDLDLIAKAYKNITPN